MALYTRRQNSLNYMKTKNRITSPYDNRYKKAQVEDRKRFEKEEDKINGSANDKHNYNRK